MLLKDDPLHARAALAELASTNSKGTFNNDLDIVKLSIYDQKHAMEPLMGFFGSNRLVTTRESSYDDL